MTNNNSKIIKVNPQNILPINEAWAATAGFSTSPDYGNPAFSYEIKPLSFTLCQKGNDPEMLNKNKSFKFFVGDHVSGYCPYDGKKHEGMIKYFYWVPGSDGTMPKFVYIQDFSNEDTIPLEAESIKQTLTKYTPNDLAVKDYYRARDTEIAHDYGATEMSKNVFEGKNFDFNNVLNESILEEYGLLYIFSLNEGEASNMFQKFKQPLINAFNKIKSKFGDKSCRHIADIIKKAQAKGKGALYGILTIITLLSSTLSANAKTTPKFYNNLKQNVEIAVANMADAQNMSNYEFSDFAESEYYKFAKLFLSLDSEKFARYCGSGVGYSEIEQNAINMAYSDALQYVKQQYGENAINDYGLKFEIVKQSSSVQTINGGTTKSYYTVVVVVYQDVPPPPINEVFDFNFNGKTLNEQYAYLNEARVMAKKFFEDNFDLKPAKGFSFKQYVDKSTGAYVTSEPFDGKPTGTMKFFAKHGISKVYNGSIGFSEKEQKWYGWSHRAIYGFGIGSKVKKGDCGYKGKAWTAKTLDDAKQMAKDFADAVS